MPPHQPKPPHPGDLIKIIRNLSTAGKLAFSTHAFDERMGERGIEQGDVLNSLRLGDIEGAIVAGKRDGEWPCLVRGRLEWAGRDAGIAPWS
jgi:hypothetical protein